MNSFPGEFTVKIFNNFAQVLSYLKIRSRLLAIEFIICLLGSVFFEYFQIYLVRFRLLSKSQAVSMGLILDHVLVLGAFEMNEIIWGEEFLADIESTV